MPYALLRLVGGQEFYLEQELLGLGLEAYCPKYGARVRNRHSASPDTRWVVSLRPLFPGYGFMASGSIGKELRYDIRPKIGYVWFGATLATITDDQFALIRQVEKEMENMDDSPPKAAVPKVGDKVTIKVGVMLGMVGSVKSKHGKLLCIEVPNWPVAWMLPADMVEVVS